jgi:hypothetical protein
MNILALDLGTKTGWALRENGRIESGVQTFDVKRGESPGMRYVRFNRWLSESLPGGDLAGVRLVCYEQTHNRGGSATEVAAGFATRVQEACAKAGIEHAAVHSATLKKWVTGSGRGNKDDMAAAVMAKGWLTQAKTERCYDGKLDDNEVDAVALLHYALSELAPDQEPKRWDTRRG